MATSPENSPGLPPEFRAPPPSPVAGANGSMSGSPEDDDLDGFLTHSLCVPHLIMPDRIFPREPTSTNPPEIDLGSLISSDIDGSAVKLLKSTAGTVGCFQVVNHGIPNDLIRAVGVAAAGAFRIPPEKKKAVSRSPERRWGFEVEEDEEEEDESGGEGFLWWCGRRDEEMAGIWPQGYKDFSDKMEWLCMEMEKIARKIEEILLDKDTLQTQEVDCNKSVLCLHKHGRNNKSCSDDQYWFSPLKHGAVQTMVRNSDYSHALGMHVGTVATSGFHVYSKRGWNSFCPSDEAIVVTAGDQIQAWSGGLYKHVVGKSVFSDEENQDSISIALLYSNPTIINTPSSCSITAADGEKTISLARQLMLAACLTLLYHFITYIYGNV